MILRNRTVVALLAAGDRLDHTADVGDRNPVVRARDDGSAARMSWVAATEIAAMGIFGILAGGLPRAGARDAARLRHRPAPLTLAIPLLYAADRLPFVVLLALVFAIGAFSAPAFGARVAIVPDVVGEDERLIGKLRLSSRRRTG